MTPTARATARRDSTSSGGEASSSVAASHGHYDHYDVDAFSAYPDRAVPMIVKRGIGDRAMRAGFTE